MKIGKCVWKYGLIGSALLVRMVCRSGSNDDSDGGSSRPRAACGHKVAIGMPADQQMR